MRRRGRLIRYQVILILLMFCYSCQSNLGDARRAVVKIIFDTDMGSDCDDVGALALLHAYADMGKVEIIGCIYSSGKVPFGAGVVDAINMYYGRPDIPVGAYYKQDVGDSVDKMNAEKLVWDTATFGNRIVCNRDAQEQTRLNRQLLTAQEDHSIVYVTVGHTKGLYDLLRSEPDEVSPLNGYELVISKIKQWVALGALNANNEGHRYAMDWNFFFNGTANYTDYLVKHFPRPVCFVNAGTDILTGKSLKGTPTGNIVRRAYEEWLWNYEQKRLDAQRPSWDIVTVYFAVEGLGDYLEEAMPGWLEFDPNKGCRWVAGENNLHHTYIIEKEGIEEEFADYLNELIARAPEHAVLKRKY